MSSLASIAQSGLSAAQLRLDASAGNIANMNTPGYRAQRVEQQASGNGGVDARVDRVPAPGVSLEQEIVEQLAASHAFKANLHIMRTGDEVLGRLLDTRA